MAHFSLESLRISLSSFWPFAHDFFVLGGILVFDDYLKDKDDVFYLQN